MDAVREAGEHERPVGQVGQHPRRGPLVVVQQVAFGEILLRKEDLVAVGHRHLAHRFGFVVRFLQEQLGADIGAGAFLRRLVVAQAQKHRLAQMAVEGILPILDFADQQRRHPTHFLVRDQRLALGQVRQLPLHFLPPRLAEAGTNATAERQLSATVFAERQCAQIGGIAFLRNPAGDHEVVAAVGAHLQPVAAAPARVGRIGALAHHPFEPQLGDGVEGLDAVALHMVGEAQRPGFRQQLAQQRLAFQQRQPLQVVAGGVQQVEGVDDHRVVPRRARRGQFAAHRGARLQQAEARLALLIVHHHLAVDGELAARQQAGALDDLRKARRQVQAAAGAQGHVVAAPLDEQAVAVVLDLEHPAVAVEGRRGLGEHGLFEQRPACRRAWAQRVEPFPKGRLLQRRFRQLGNGEAGEHRTFRQRPLASPLVGLLDEQPLLAGVVAPLERDQREASAQLVAVQLEQELAVLEAVLEVLQGQVGAVVPDGDLASAVVAGRDRALEVRVLHGMVFHLHGEALVLGIHGRALGHRPGLQHVAHFEAEVPMQARGGVLLHHEQSPRAAGRGRSRAAEGLRRGRGAAALAVDAEALARRRFAAAASAG